MNESLIGFPTGQPQAVIITVASDYIDRIDELAATLAKSGLKVRDVMAGVGAINGDVKVGDISKIEKVAGVKKVSRSMMNRPRGEWSPRG